jgi:hypothetical protein
MFALSSVWELVESVHPLVTLIAGFLIGTLFGVWIAKTA